MICGTPKGDLDTTLLTVVAVPFLRIRKWDHEALNIYLLDLTDAYDLIAIVLYDLDFFVLHWGIFVVTCSG
jgi:hypothetical protein